MKSKREARTRSKLRLVRAGPIIGGAVAAAVFAAAPLPLPGFAAPAYAASSAAVPQGQDVKDFYAIRRGAPLWFHGGQPSAAAQDLLRLLNSASLDGLNPADYHIDAVTNAMKAAWGGNPHAVRKADVLLSQAFVDYARDLRDAPDAGMAFVYPDLQPNAPSPLVLLQTAARAPSLDQFVHDLGWMNPIYTELREALASGTYADQRNVIRINMARARVLPAGRGRYVLVNPAEQRLYMYDKGKVADSMKVVVGQTEPAMRNTPMFATYINDAKLNPYWNVPPDLVGDDVAIHVLKQGLGYLDHSGFQVLSDWGENPTVVDPSTIDWQAAYDGKLKLRIRQLPGPHNVLGDVKFDMPNRYGVYLHDTTQRDLLDLKVRLRSGGCIRLEDADRFGTWLFGHPLKAESDDPDIKVKLGVPVPLYVTYLTAIPSGSSVTFLDDVYGRDDERLAELNGGGSTNSVAIR